MVDSPFKMALLRGFLIALCTGLLTLLTTWGSLTNWDSKTVLIAAGTAFLTTFLARGLGEGAYDQKRDNDGDVRASDVHAPGGDGPAPAPPPAPAPGPG
jgi:hypothetical protein